MSQKHFLSYSDFNTLFTALKETGHECIGPVVRDGAIIYDTVNSVEDFPQGIRDTQEPGKYRLNKTDSSRYFSWANGPQALKPLSFSSREILWQTTRDENGHLTCSSPEQKPQLKAVFGVRACDLAAIAIHDKHFLRPGAPDPYYWAKRKALFIIAVNCTHPASTCFCASTGDGPEATYGYDIGLSELDDGFVIESRSSKGADILAKLPLKEVTQSQIDDADEEIVNAASQQQRRVPGRNLNELLMSRQEHPRWEEIAEKCLSCGNCTSVCPTCFCHSEVEQPSLDGNKSEHYRQWDSCFTEGHSYITGFTVRPDTASRYKQWLTHKFGGWHEQYGRSGCVGCGRCVSWCPVGIDVTEELDIICRDGK